MRDVLIIILLFTMSHIISGQSKGQKWVKTYSEEDSIQIPFLEINSKKYIELESLYFYSSVGGIPIKEETTVQMMYDDEYLKIKFECRDNPRMNQNYYTQDNSPMFSQEVFEIFISNGDQSNEKYVEIQLNPNNALYLSKITNRFKSDGKFINEPVDTKTAGIKHEVFKDVKNEIWSGYLQIPLKLLKYPMNSSESTYRMNLYRIISIKDQNSLEKWRNNAQNSIYACWSSTMSTRPNFHRPDYFGVLKLK